MKLSEVWVRDALAGLPTGTTRCLQAKEGTSLTYENGFVSVEMRGRTTFLIPMGNVAAMTPTPVEKPATKKTSGGAEA